ncbi:hypothetical protein RP20_CCG026290 [Aedes albopictus]|nr:hypothetical protein RP20_CCG026290 [Aedes albopictus]
MDPVPEIQLTPPSPSTSMESFETASSNIREWDLTPYQFNCPCLSASVQADDTGKELNELASIRLPEYHQLVDHTLGVAWKSICNERKDIGKMTPDQLIWAIKLIESHRSRNSQYSEDIRMVLQYFQEIVVAMCSNGGLTPTQAQSQLEPPEPLENSFVLASITPKSPFEAPSSTVAPTAASTPMPPNSAPSTLAASMEELVKNLESLHLMLVQLKKSQLRRIDLDTEQLDAIERLLQVMAAEDLNHSSHQLQMHGSGGAEVHDISQSRANRPLGTPEERNGGGRRRSSSRSDDQVRESSR